MQGAVAGICRDGFFICATALTKPTKRNGGLGQAPTRTKAVAMFKHAKYRQASLIVLATTVILILPNVTRLVG